MEMQTSHPDETARVVAAQAGDRRALEALLDARLPFVYTIVRRALSGSPEVDDVVQETMLRALRELPRLNHPESFRAWLAAITIRQISTHQHRWSRQTARTAALDEVPQDEAALAVQFEDATVLNLQVADQRGQLVRARQWLNPDDQTLLSLWWLEATGQLTRADLATALGVSIAHATVRVQRMHAQLELTRSLTAAVENRPRCSDLERVLHKWDGRPQPVWRKRILRHTRTCPTCLGAANGLIAPEGLLVGLALLPVPAALATSMLGKFSAGTATTATAAGGKAGLTAHVLQMAAAHPVSVVLLTGSVVTGAAVATTNWPDFSPMPPTPPVVVTDPVPTPSPASTTPRARLAAPVATSAPTSATTSATVSAGRLSLGPVSLEPVNMGGFYASTSETGAIIDEVGPTSAKSARARATFEVVAGLSDPTCFSFRLADGDYLRHSSWRLRSAPDPGTALFRGDATFCAIAGSTADSVSFEAANYPGWFLRHRDLQLWVDQDDGSEQFHADRSFRVRDPLS
ncbi:sigma-70 family RNA polymerase sigma factor [Kineosporia rhizophila]|uniref:sigma-70 family RNA polymerase sigma factor n=1 Tax=Kineosporia rhizophila TaxID=84633 RepID=UPI001E352B99|nr:sigma-70 family RNA polymerase sigma factor [Kineosporia rhizophila]MCE0537950.1 sigma-70 family RNA polymerase sigma factor [Kineosporia rhizophila]